MENVLRLVSYVIFGSPLVCARCCTRERIMEHASTVLLSIPNN